METPAKDPWNAERIEDHLKHFLSRGPLCGSTIIKIAEDFGIPKRAMQINVQLGLERGTLKVDDGLRIELNNGVN